jgi:hypothetical protein
VVFLVEVDGSADDGIDSDGELLLVGVDNSDEEFALRSAYHVFAEEAGNEGLL